MTRAVLEGVAFAMRDCLETLHSVGAVPTSMRFGGGGARGELWRQIMASALNMPLTTLAGGEQTALGAALLAAVGCGSFATVEEAAAAWVQPVGDTLPEPEWVDLYQERYSIYRQSPGL
jgi:xylulokinase